MCEMRISAWLVFFDMLFLDCSKAFDSISHALLLHRPTLKLLCFSDQLLAWFKDYLSDRRQRVVLDNCSSGCFIRSHLVCLKDLY